MTLRLRQRLWLLLILIVLTLAIISNAEQAVLSEDAIVETKDSSSSNPDAIHDTTEKSSRETYPGDGAVQEANAILQKLKPYPKRPPRYSKPSGFLGNILYYIRETFKFLFLNSPSKNIRHSSQDTSRPLTEPLASAVALLQEAAQQDNADALHTLAELNFYGSYTHPRNYVQAFKYYNDLAAINGNRSAQHMIGFMYATGIGGAVEKDQAKALLYDTFAANAGDTRAQMSVAFRHHAGISTPKNCDKALRYYKKAADKAIQYVQSGPPGGRAMVKEAYRLADEHGGVYGEGASASSTGSNAAKGGPTSENHAAFDDVLEFLDLMSRQGELKATFGLGRLHYEGSRSLRQDYRIAKDHFLDIARKYWTKDGKIKPETEPGVEKLASKAAGYLGRMFLRGEGTAQDFQKAQIWFRRGIKNGDALCQYSMGLIYRDGLGVQQDPVKAAEYFGAAADQDFTPGQVKLGALLLDQGDLASAIRYFDLASRNGHIEGFYYLAEVYRQGIGREASCSNAALFYKVVAEKAEVLHSSFAEANDAYEAGDLETALIHYMMAAEQGYEIGQANVAFLLDQQQRNVSSASALNTFVRKFNFIPAAFSFTRAVKTTIGDAALALIYWTRSAKQANTDSLVKMGDYYLNGLGTEESLPDSEKAAACYQAAAETLQSAQALWNLGWMHENGIGIEQDFHLAKRFYDQSLETNKEAYLPVKLSLAKLRVRSAWNTLTRGKVNPIRDEEKEDGNRRYSFHEWLSRFLEADLEMYEAAVQRERDRDEQGVEAGGADEWDATTGAVAGEDIYDELEDGLLETFLICALAGALAFLVWYRQQRQQQDQARRRAQEDQNPGAGQNANDQQEDRGMFPAPGDAELNNWVVGGVGH